jgi:hypothetical protein
MIETLPVGSLLCQPAANGAVEPRKCASEGCDVIFFPQHKNRRYHDDKCQKKSENQRLRGPSFTERVIAAKGRRCIKCHSECEGRRTAFYWDGDAGNIDRAVVLCSGCLKWAHGKRKGQIKGFDILDAYAEQDKAERALQEESGCCILTAEDAGVVNGPPQVINRSNLDEASCETHPRELFCRYCENRLCQVSAGGDVIALNKREIVCENGAVACSRCRERDGREVWTKISEALPDTVTHGPIPAPERLLKVDRISLNGRTLSEMLHDLGIAKLTGQIPPHSTVL